MSVTGVLAPLRVKPVPDSVICEILTSALPVLVMVSERVDEFPVFTVPKARLVELNESTRVCATPVPLREMVAGELEALLTMLTEPLTEPAAVGENSTLKVVDCPAVRLMGKDTPVVLKPLPLTLT